MPKKSAENGLHNTIYDQQTRSGRRLTKGRRWLYQMAAPLVVGLMRAHWKMCKVVRVIGGEYVTEALARAPSFIPVYWHQHQLFCAKHLFDLRAVGVRPGILVSPSVDGEFGALLVRRLGGDVIRGSSTHTGARTLRDFYQALVREHISPVITPDGPKGPPWKFKSGALLLAQLSARPIIPMTFYASRAWLVSWDRFVIPKFASRIVIAVGEAVYVPKHLDAAGIDALAQEMEARLGALFQAAKSAMP